MRGGAPCDRIPFGNTVAWFVSLIQASTAQQSIVLAGAGRERPILEHLHLPQEVFQEVYSDAVSEQTYYRWRKEYGGLRTDQAKRLKELEKENARVERLRADAEWDKAILKIGNRHPPGHPAGLGVRSDHPPRPTQVLFFAATY